nr:MAG TPA: hypothetical protein [Caudoviricetes sp.]
MLRFLIYSHIQHIDYNLDLNKLFTPITINTKSFIIDLHL